MNIDKLKAAHDRFKSEGIAIYVPAVQTLSAAIDEHINEHKAEEGLQAKVAELEAQIVALNLQ